MARWRASLVHWFTGSQATALVAIGSIASVLQSFDLLLSGFQQWHYWCQSLFVLLFLRLWHLPCVVGGLSFSSLTDL